MIRKDLAGRPWLSIISAHRPENVAKMGALVGNATWYVPENQVDLYRGHGAEFVEPDGGGLCPARNAALRDAWIAGGVCVQLSDDLSGVKEAYYDEQAEKNKARNISFHAAQERIWSELEGSDAYLAGCAPTANPFFFHPDRAVGRKHFIVGDYVVIKACSLTWDNNLRLKEDYDYTLQHLTEFGEVVRCNDIMPVFAHRTNKGGACAVRTSDLEQESIRYLKEKWPGKLRDNPRRKDEILLKW